MRRGGSSARTRVSPVESGVSDLFISTVESRGGI